MPLWTTFATRYCEMVPVSTYILVTCLNQLLYLSSSTVELLFLEPLHVSRTDQLIKKIPKTSIIITRICNQVHFSCCCHKYSKVICEMWHQHFVSFNIYLIHRLTIVKQVYSSHGIIVYMSLYFYVFELKPALGDKDSSS